MRLTQRAADIVAHTKGYTTAPLRRFNCPVLVSGIH